VPRHPRILGLRHFQVIATVPVARLRDDLVRLADRGADVDEYARAATRVLRRALPFDGVCVVTMDPLTQLPTSEFVDSGLPESTRARMAEIEGGGRDHNAFSALARSDRSAAALSDATGGDLNRSVRHRELRAPNRFGDELRAVLADDGAIWGGLTLLRGDDQPDFTQAETATLASLSRVLTDGLRRAVLLTDRLVAGGDEEEPPGVLLLGPDNAIVMSDAAADTWLGELRESGLGHPVPQTVSAVAARARGLAADASTEQPAARARVRTARGGWLVVRGSALGSEPDALTAVTLEPARPRDLAPLIADAYGLTPRERAVTQLVAEGLPTSAIARRLYLSAWTVQDHLKVIFEKVGVTTRGELVARVFLDDRPPLL
jgi:DNA-binding CsgD family transcriptional regulator